MRINLLDTVIAVRELDTCLRGTATLEKWRSFTKELFTCLTEQERRDMITAFQEKL